MCTTYTYVPSLILDKKYLSIILKYVLTFFQLIQFFPEQGITVFANLLHLHTVGECVCTMYIIMYIQTMYAYRRTYIRS